MELEQLKETIAVLREGALTIALLHDLKPEYIQSFRDTHTLIKKLEARVVELTQ